MSAFRVLAASKRRRNYNLLMTRAKNNQRFSCSFFECMKLTFFFVLFIYFAKILIRNVRCSYLSLAHTHMVRKSSFGNNPSSTAYLYNTHYTWIAQKKKVFYFTVLLMGWCENVFGTAVYRCALQCNFSKWAKALNRQQKNIQIVKWKIYSRQTTVGTIRNIMANVCNEYVISWSWRCVHACALLGDVCRASPSPGEWSCLSYRLVTSLFMIWRRIRCWVNCSHAPTDKRAK